MARAFIALGSNLGDRHGYIESAKRAMARLPRTRLVGFSTIYETAPVGPVAQGDYLNAAAELATELDPFELLAQLSEIEHRCGRPPPPQRVAWGPRTVDLDILLYDERTISTAALVVPHPRMHERSFVLQPLAELAPEVRHPVLHRTIRELLTAIQAPR